MNADIKNKLSSHISSIILRQPNRVLDGDAPLISSGLIDSFNLVDLALFIEDEFGVHIDDSELNSDTFDTLNALVALIESRMK